MDGEDHPTDQEAKQDVDGLETEIVHDDCTMDGDVDVANSGDTTSGNIDVADGSVVLNPEGETDFNATPRNLGSKGFEYNDWDSLENELCELYGLYELHSIDYMKYRFITYLESRFGRTWQSLENGEKVNLINDLLDQLEMADEDKQTEAILLMNHIVQGCWSETNGLSEQLKVIEMNVKIMLECDAFWRIRTFYEFYYESLLWKSMLNEKLIDEDRIPEYCFNVLCTIAITSMRNLNTSETGTTSCLFMSLVERLIGETTDEEPFVVSLFKDFIDIVERNPRCYLVKKILLLIRWTLLIIAGGSADLRKLKEVCREKAGLKPSKEDTILTCRAIDPIQDSSMWCQSQAAEKLLTLAELDELANTIETMDFSVKKSLPWTPKSSIKSLRILNSKPLVNSGSQQTRLLSFPAKQRVTLLAKHVHVPLADYHIEQEKLISKYPFKFSQQEKPFVETTEKVFSFLLPILEPVIRSLVKVLSEATPRKRLPESSFILPTVSESSSSSTYDSQRQAEIVVKSISAVLLLLLKHTKINHIYQFECIASEVVAASFMPTVLRYFNRDVEKYLKLRPNQQNIRSSFEVLNVELRLSCEESEIGGGSAPFSWRNMYACVNLLRILNKIVKGKPSRILMLRMFKAPDCLKRGLNIRDSLYQQYTLKLLRMLCKYLGKEWKRINSQIISAVYVKVRHRLLDDWVAGSDTKDSNKTWPWEFPNEESQIHEDILLYLHRKSQTSNELYEETAFEDYFEIPESFEAKYEEWLQREVHSNEIDWDRLLRLPCYV